MFTFGEVLLGGLRLDVSVESLAGHSCTLVSVENHLIQEAERYEVIALNEVIVGRFALELILIEDLQDIVDRITADPVSAFAGFEVFVRDVLHKLGGGKIG